MMPAINLQQAESVQTTITLPADLLERIQRLVEADYVPSRNALIVAALQHFLDALEQQAIDLQFAAMADNHAYQVLNEQLAEEFADSDWEALGLLEKDGP